MRSSLPKLDDVAHLAGVSTATVSRCLNQPDQVMKTTRKRVFDAIDQLGYMPNFGARALAAKRSNTVGAVIPTMENSIFARGLQAFQENLSTQNYDLLVASSSYRREQEEKQIRSLIARGAEGLLLIGTERDDVIYDFLAERDIPFVIAWSFQDQNDGPQSNHFVGFDNRAAMVEMTRKVLSFGHKNIAMMSGITRDNDRACDRVNGFKSAIAESGAGDNVSIIECDYNIENARKAFLRLIEQEDGLTAIICGNDVLASAAIIEAREYGLRVPEDISITGFDDIEIASIISPGLTTVHVPHRLMGQKAAQILLQHINEKTAWHNYKFETYIIERGSLGYNSSPGAYPR